MDYRKDLRSDAEFRRDIKKWHRVENDAAEVFQQILTKALMRPVLITPNGCDMSGEYLEDEQVNTEPDFYMQFPHSSIDGRYLEIKAAAQQLGLFHIKVDQVASYLKQHPTTLILMVRGTETDNPQFTFFGAKVLTEEPFQKVRFESWGGKLCYRLYAEMFHWEPFKVLDQYPRNYFGRQWVHRSIVRRLKRSGNTFYSFRNSTSRATTAAY